MEKRVVSGDYHCENCHFGIYDGEEAFASEQPNGDITWLCSMCVLEILEERDSYERA